MNDRLHFWNGAERAGISWGFVSGPGVRAGLARDNPRACLIPTVHATITADRPAPRFSRSAEEVSLKRALALVFVAAVSSGLGCNGSAGSTGSGTGGEPGGSGACGATGLAGEHHPDSRRDSPG